MRDIRSGGCVPHALDALPVSGRQLLEPFILCALLGHLVGIVVRASITVGDGTIRPPDPDKLGHGIEHSTKFLFHALVLGNIESRTDQILDLLIRRTLGRQRHGKVEISSWVWVYA